MCDIPFQREILEAIDQLRRRKARPDLERICNLLQRRHSVSPHDTKCDLEKLVDAEIVIKVEYKGNTSYRNAAKWTRYSLYKKKPESANTLVLNSERTSSMLSNSLSDIFLRQPDYLESGVPYREIERHMQAKDYMRFTKRYLDLVLQREIKCGNLVKLENGHYALADAKRAQVSTNVRSYESSKIQHTRPDGKEFEKGSLSQNNSHTASTSSTTTGFRVGVRRKRARKMFDPSDMHVPRKRGRPVGSGRRSATVTTQVATQSVLPTPAAPVNPAASESSSSSGRFCCYCGGVANRRGQPEALTQCKECRTKAHSTCIEFNENHTGKVRLPWHCAECRSCAVCNENTDPDSLIFCSTCEKGYHTFCHAPPVHEKSAANWTCFRCQVEASTWDQSVSGAGGLLTPRESPVPEGPSFSELDDKIPDASAWDSDDVENYFAEQGFPEQASVLKEQEIDGQSLLLMKRSDVLCGLKLKLGPALKIYSHVKRLQTRQRDIDFLWA